jgi:hypothetical protein
MPSNKLNIMSKALIMSMDCGLGSEIKATYNGGHGRRVHEASNDNTNRANNRRPINRVHFLNHTNQHYDEKHKHHKEQSQHLSLQKPNISQMQVS